RALVANPQVLLMDEPFSALDPSLREEMRELLSRIQKQFRVTVLFVTHDREEAFQLSDRIGVMSEGSLLQVGKARELYERPESRKIASFMGLKNSIEGIVAAGRFTSADRSFDVPVDETIEPGPCHLILRPEVVQLKTLNEDPLQDSIQCSGVIQQLRFNHGFYTGTIQIGIHLLDCSFTSQQA